VPVDAGSIVQSFLGCLPSSAQGSFDTAAQNMIQSLRSHALTSSDQTIALCSWVHAILACLTSAMTSAALSAGLLDILLDMLHSTAAEVG
jgi:hypothetical protein